MAPHALPSDSDIQSRLAPPGAGIPFLQRWVGRYIIKPFVMRTAPWRLCERNFKRAHEKIKKELLAFPQERVTERVLVPPQQGLEDSSRYWSAAMVARHLTIVGVLMEEGIVKLTRYEPVDIEASTATVKPEVTRNESGTIAAYIHFADDVVERIRQGLGEQSSGATLAHPWFGPMTAREWYFLLGLHTRVHLKQLRAIRRGLKAQA